MTEATLNCGKCNVPLQAPENPKPDDIVRCPSCGDAERYSEVMDQATKAAADFYKKGLQETLRNATRGSKYLKFKPGE